MVGVAAPSAPSATIAHAAPAAGEQGHAKFKLQALDRLGQRRLGHVQARGGTAEVQFFGQRDKLAPHTQLDH